MYSGGMMKFIVPDWSPRWSSQDEQNGTQLRWMLAENLLTNTTIDIARPCIIEEGSNQRTPGREIWRTKCQQQVLGPAGGRCCWQHKTALERDNLSVVCTILED